MVGYGGGGRNAGAFGSALVTGSEATGCGSDFGEIFVIDTLDVAGCWVASVALGEDLHGPTAALKEGAMGGEGADGVILIGMGEIRPGDGVFKIEEGAGTKNCEELGLVGEGTSFRDTGNCGLRRKGLSVDGEEGLTL